MYCALWFAISSLRHKCKKLLDKAAEYFYRDDNTPSKYNRICSECMDKTLKSFATNIILIVLSFSIAVVGPVRSYLDDGTLVTLFEFRMPFLTQNPDIEFIANLTWQGILSLLALPAFFALEGCKAVVNNAIDVSSKRSALEFDEISNKLETNGLSKNEASLLIKRAFLKIIAMDR